MNWNQLVSQASEPLERMIGKSAQLLQKTPTEVEKCLKDVFEVTDAMRREATKSIREIRYLLIAEAPPWPENGEISYFYSPLAKSQTPFLDNVYRAFFGIKEKVEFENKAIMIDAITRQGFLLLDLLPFALPYGKCDLRSPIRDYRALIEESKGYLTNEIRKISRFLTRDVRVCVAYKCQCDPMKRSFKEEKFLLPAIESGGINTSTYGVPREEDLRRGFGLDRM